jgi:transglutaminase-like putative cysteine protease
MLIDKGAVSAGCLRGHGWVTLDPAPATAPPKRSTPRLEHLRDTALGFRNLTNYITRALLDTGGFRPRIHPLLR